MGLRFVEAGLTPHDVELLVLVYELHRLAATPHPTNGEWRMSEANWYALRTSSQDEFVAEQILRMLGHEVYLPVEMKLRHKTRYCKQRRWTPFPLLSRYVFVRPEPPVPWAQLFMVPCVQSVVGFNGEPHPIEDRDIAALEAIASNQRQSSTNRYMHTKNEFEAGDQVIIVQGPFEGRLVPVEEVEGRKAGVWLELFGTKKLVQVDIDALEKVA